MRKLMAITVLYDALNYLHGQGQDVADTLLLID